MSFPLHRWLWGQTPTLYILPPPFIFYPHPFYKGTLFTEISNPKPFYNSSHILFIYFWYIQSCILTTDCVHLSPTASEWLHQYYMYYPYCGSYFQGNLVISLPQIYKMLSNLLWEKDLHPCYFVSTFCFLIQPPFLVKKCQPPPFYQFSKSQTGTL